MKDKIFKILETEDYKKLSVNVLEHQASQISRKGKVIYTSQERAISSFYQTNDLRTGVFYKRTSLLIGRQFNEKFRDFGSK